MTTSGPTPDPGGDPDGTDGDGDASDSGRLGLTSLRQAVGSSPAEVDDRYERVQALKGRISVARHGLGARLSHWTQVVLMSVMILTGFAIRNGLYGPLDVSPWGGYYVAFGAHMWAGILLVAFLFVLFPLYHLYVDGHHVLVKLADLRIVVGIAQAFVGLRSYIPGYHRARESYDETEGDWVAYHPMQKSFFWWISLFFAVLALTGFGMFADMRTDPIWWVELLGFLGGWFGFVLLKRIHLLSFFLVVAMIIGHVYFALLPSNREILKSMVFGEMDAYVLDEGDPNEDEG